HKKATTALAQALLSKEAVAAQLAIQECLGSLHSRKEEHVGEYPLFEDEAKRIEFTKAGSTLAQLKFLRKWEQQCQDRLLRLINC
ncbi:MAG: hypothetical protein AAF733_12905, partial [Verrucomicrobiota bacterium]